MRLFVLGGGRIMALAGRGGTLGGDPGGELAIALCYGLLPQNMMELKCRGFLGGLMGEVSSLYCTEVQRLWLTQQRSFVRRFGEGKGEEVSAAWEGGGFFFLLWQHNAFEC